MANFEGLIRGALATRDSGDPTVRKQIYQSSRNALNRLIEENRSLTVEAALNQQRMLEETIQQIEAGFTEAETVPSAPQDHESAPPHPQDHVPAPPQMPESHVLPEQETFNSAVMEDTHQIQPIQIEQGPAAASTTEIPAQDPLREIQSLLEGQPAGSSDNAKPSHDFDTPVPPQFLEPGDPVPIEPGHPPRESQVSVSEEDIRMHGLEQSEPSLAVSADDFVEDRTPPAGFSNRRKLQKRFLTIGILLGIFALFGWIAYVVVVGYLDGTLLQSGSDQRLSETAGVDSGQDPGGDYITIIEPGDLSALVTAGRGESEIVNQLNTEMIRIVSVRDGDSRNEPARPILIKIRPGILEKIAGKVVNVEIFAKSAGNAPATFSVECQFGALGECGRKRFRIGLQPEAVVFSIMMREGETTGSEAYLAINTDITGTAEITGRGDVLDIVYARLRPAS